MEIYKTPLDSASKEFEKLLNSSLSKTQIEEGKIIEGKINKITEKYVFLHCDGLKSEPVLDINELKTMGLSEKIKIGETIPVLLERLEDKMGEVVVSASKAKKIVGWETLVKSYEKDETVMGRIKQPCKGGAIVEHIDTGSLMFLPGSQISDSPLKSKDLSNLIDQPMKFKLIKLDRQRGNICCSRREVISSFKKEDKAKVVSKYKVGDIIKNAQVKGFSSFGAFFSTGDLDVLTHLQELSWSRIDSPDQILEIGQVVPELKVISVDMDKLQVGTSLKQMTEDPFNNIQNYELNKIYKCKVMKLADFGAFVELEPGLTALLHQSQLSWTKKNASAKKMFKLHEMIEVVIQEIDESKRRVAVSYKLTQENPYQKISELHPVGSEDEAEVVNKNEYALFVKFKDSEIECFQHVNDLTFSNNADEELAKYKTGDKIKVKVMEIQTEEQRVRVSHRATLKDPFDWFKDKKNNQIITVKIVSTDTKGLIVRPVDMEPPMDFQIKKSNIAINAADTRTSRFVGGEKVDAAIQDLKYESRKVTLSIKLKEELDRAEALEKYGTTEGSGKSLPFESLADVLKKGSSKKKDNKN
jgi:small subunit ribosomal protein S1